MNQNASKFECMHYGSRNYFGDCLSYNFISKSELCVMDYVKGLRVIMSNDASFKEDLHRTAVIASGQYAWIITRTFRRILPMLTL